MKIKTAALATLILLAASVPVTARKNPACPFLLQTPITMDGAEIPQGKYDVTLESSNSTVRVTFWREGQFVATASGAWVKNGVKYTENAFLVRVNSDGSRSLAEIRLAGSAKTIVLSNSSAVVRISAR